MHENVFPNVSSFSADALRAATVNQNDKANMITVWDAASGRSLAIKSPAGFVYCVAVSALGDWLVSGSREHTLTMFDFATGGFIREFKANTSEWPCLLSFSPEGGCLVSGSDGGTIRIWNAATGDIVQTVNGPTGRVRAIAFVPSGLRIVSGGSRLLKARDQRTGKRKVDPMVLWEFPFDRRTLGP